jgi:hypothetical protein
MGFTATRRSCDALFCKLLASLEKPKKNGSWKPRVSPFIQRIFGGIMKNVSKLVIVGFATLALGLGLTRVGAQSRYDFAGTYNVTGVNPDGSKFTDVVVVSDYGDGYRVDYGEGETGIANDLGTSIAIASQNKGIPTVTLLKIVNGSQLEGYWQSYNSKKEGTETWTQN